MDLARRPSGPCPQNEPHDDPHRALHGRDVPDNAATAFATAARLGYDAVEVMVWTDGDAGAGALRALSEHHGLPIASVHAPTLLLTQRVWGTDPWDKVDRSIELALEVGAPTVVLHPPFRWQRTTSFIDGVALREHDTGIRLAVENMFPWRTARREMLAYLPHWDPVDQPYDNVTMDLSHGDGRLGCPAHGARAQSRLAPPPRRRSRVVQGRAPRSRPRVAAVQRGPRAPRRHRLVG